MSNTATLRLPKSPGNRKPVATQYAPNQGQQTFIMIYQHGNAYYAYASGSAYQVPSPAHDVLTSSPATESWLYDEAIAQADRVHYLMHRPTPADASRHFLLAELVEQGTLNFDTAWDMFRGIVEEAGADVDPDVAPTTWHKEFAEQWLILKAELEARS